MGRVWGYVKFSVIICIGAVGVDDEDDEWLSREEYGGGGTVFCLSARLKGRNVSTSWGKKQRRVGIKVNPLARQK